MKKKTKKGNKKAVVKKAVVKKEVDTFGFAKGSKSSAAIKLLSDGKPLKAARQKFSTLSFSKLLEDLKGRGFEVKEDDKGLCSVVAKP